LNSPKLFRASAALAKECRRLIIGVPAQFNLDHRSQLLRIAGTLLSEEFKTAHRQRMSSVSVDKHLAGSFENLKVDELLNLSVGELAEKFGYTRRHLNRLFHQFFGYSVAALRMEMRLLRAVCLLRDLDAKVVTVAEQCGFNHLGLFNNPVSKDGSARVPGDGAERSFAKKASRRFHGEIIQNVHSKNVRWRLRQIIASRDYLKQIIATPKCTFRLKWLAA
jgi:AraC-like DNA-binding protein